MSETPPPTAPAEDPAALSEWEGLHQHVQAGHFDSMPAPFMNHVRRNLEQHGYGVEPVSPVPPVPLAGQHDLETSDRAVAVEAAPSLEGSFRAVVDQLSWISQTADPETTIFDGDLKAALRQLDISKLKGRQLNELVRQLAICDTAVFDHLPPDAQRNWGQSVTINALLTFLPEATIRKFYERPMVDERTPNYLHTYLKHSALTDNLVKQQAYLLSVVHWTDGGIENLPPGSDENVDRMRPFASAEWMHKTDIDALIKALPERPADFDQATVKAFNDEWLDRAQQIFDKIGLNRINLKQGINNGQPDAGLGQFLLDTMDSRLRDGDAGTYYKTSLARYRFARINSTVHEVGLPLIERLHRELGIVNLDNYASEDLRSLEKLLDGDAELVKHLKDGDTTVVLSDALGDHNGAIGEAFDQYRQTNGRTLMFEVTGPGGFYRPLIRLNKLGIKPSTIVVAAHGDPGMAMFGRGPQRFSLTSSDRMRQSAATYPLPRTAINRLAVEYMQAMSDGRPRRFIMNSCSSDVEFVSGRNYFASIAETVAQLSGERVSTDVYGAGDIMYAESEHEADAPGSITKSVTFKSWRESQEDETQGQNVTNLLSLKKGVLGWKVKRTEAVRIMI